jgi:hypothetical protein
MRCAVDVDGLPPLSSGCNGDSGGPLYAGPPSRPVLVGVTSWGGLRCGADGLPSVFADVVRARRFVTDPAPTWAPARTSRRGRITGAARAGRTLTCRVSGRRAPGTRVGVVWERQGGGPARRVGVARRYAVARADRGHQLLCRVLVSNDGGQVSAPIGPAALRRVPR